MLFVMADTLDIWECTLRLNGDNTVAVNWSRNGSATTTNVTSTILCTLALHQRRKRYIPWFDCLPGFFNKPSDDASRLFNLTDQQFLSYFNTTYPQSKPWTLWTPPPELLSHMTSVLHNKTHKAELPKNASPPTTTCETSGVNTAPTWPSTPYLRTSLIPSQSTVNMTIELPPHWLDRLQELLASIPPTQKRISVEKWQ